MKIFSSTGFLTKHLHYGTRLDPARDWIALLTLSMIAFVAIIAWNVWAFDTVAQGGAIGSPDTNTPPAFSRSSLDAIHAIFTKRAVEETKYKTGVYIFTDPSQY